MMGRFMLLCWWQCLWGLEALEDCPSIPKGCQKGGFTGVKQMQCKWEAWGSRYPHGCYHTKEWRCYVSECCDGYASKGSGCERKKQLCFTGGGSHCKTCQSLYTNSYCATCNGGHFRSGTSCRGYICNTGGGAGCNTCKSQSARTGNNDCATCNNGHYLSGTSCQAYTCSTGGGAGCKTCKSQSARTGNNHCETCNNGHYLSGSSCTAYTCSTAVGASCRTCLSPLARTTNNHCASCNDGYDVSGTACKAKSKFCYSGEGSSCKTCKSQYTNKHCATCNNGYYLSGSSCMAYTCSTGVSASCQTCLSQSARTTNNHCATCHGGHYRSGTSCHDYTCSTGDGAGCNTCESQSARTANNHCASCNGGHYRSGTSCRAYTCSTGVNASCQTCQLQSARTTNNHCATCNGGHYRSDTSCRAYAQWQVGPKWSPGCLGDTQTRSVECPQGDKCALPMPKKQQVTNAQCTWTKTIWSACPTLFCKPGEPGVLIPNVVQERDVSCPKAGKCGGDRPDNKRSSCYCTVKQTITSSTTTPSPLPGSTSSIKDQYKLLPGYCWAQVLSCRGGASRNKCGKIIFRETAINTKDWSACSETSQSSSGDDFETCWNAETTVGVSSSLEAGVPGLGLATVDVSGSNTHGGGECRTSTGAVEGTRNMVCGGGQAQHEQGKSYEIEGMTAQPGERLVKCVKGMNIVVPTDDKVKKLYSKFFYDDQISGIYPCPHACYAMPKPYIARLKGTAAATSTAATAGNRNKSSEPPFGSGGSIGLTAPAVIAFLLGLKVAQ